MKVTKIGFGWVGLISLGILVASCSGSADPRSSSALSSTVSVISSVDPCTLITVQELGGWGIAVPSKPFRGLGDTGCSWDGDLRSVVLTKGSQGLDFFDKKSTTFVNYVRNMVNSRPGARIQVSHTNTECSEAMAVGTGYVMVDMSYSHPSGGGENYRYPADPCGEALAIARTIEPRLPK